jgi:hypothetical protein
MSAHRYLPEGLVEGCWLMHDIKKDNVIAFDDIVVPAGRLADQLRAEQDRKFRGEKWLQEPLDTSQARTGALLLRSRADARNIKEVAQLA